MWLKPEQIRDRYGNLGWYHFEGGRGVRIVAYRSNTRKRAGLIMLGKFGTKEEAVYFVKHELRRIR